MAAKQKIIRITFIVILMAIFKVNQTKAECCSPLTYSIRHTCYHEVPRAKTVKYDWDHDESVLLYENEKQSKKENLVICLSKICPDGTPRTGLYCGKGQCNVFGCNCDGGCRTNSAGTREEARILFAKKYGFKY